MAQPYYDDLDRLVGDLLPENTTLVCKHFFSGAALYTAGTICASLTPVGLAFKLPDSHCAELIDSGQATGLRYFEKSPIKRGYALFPDYHTLPDDEIVILFRAAFDYAGKPA